MSIRVGINGFGRIGRLAFRVAASNPDFEIVYVNEPGGLEASAHLLEFDSVQGRWRHNVRTENGKLVVDRKAIDFAASADLKEVPWHDSEVDIMIESSGQFRTTGNPRALLRK